MGEKVYFKGRKSIKIFTVLLIFVFISLVFMVYFGVFNQKQITQSPISNKPILNSNKTTNSFEFEGSSGTSSKDFSSGGGGGGGSSSGGSNRITGSSITPNTEILLITQNSTDNSSFADNFTNLNNNYINESNNETENESNNENLINETFQLNVTNDSGVLPLNQSTGDSSVQSRTLVTSTVAKSIVNPSVIWFTQVPPSAICYNFNEVTSKISLGLGTVSLKWGIFNADYISCVTNGQKDVSVKYCLMENDLLYDDEIICNYGTATTYDCSTLNLENYHGTIVKREFTNVALSSFFDFDAEGSYIEVYAEVSNYNNYFDTYSTSDYNVRKDTCDCMSGACCNLATRPFLYKSYGSDPTGLTDYYYCAGDVVKRDYYCTGSSSYTWTDSTYDTCGTCEYCTPGDPSCNYYGTSTSCGIQDCDYLNTACRDYNDVNKYCNGAGSCNILGSCNSYSDSADGTYCGANSECDGYGGCIYCTSHSYSYCSPDGQDVYWFDACGNMQEMKTDCGEDVCYSWSNFCNGNELWRKRDCTYKGCAYSTLYDCYSEAGTEQEKIETCIYSCSNGVCNSAPTMCSQDSDCDSDGWTGSPFCFLDDVWQSYTDYFCKDAGTANSYCNSNYTNQLKEECAYGCLNGACKPLCTPHSDYTCYSRDVYWYNSCGTREEKKEECGTSGYIGDYYCYDNDVYRNYTTVGCSNSNCTLSISKNKIRECQTSGCSGGTCCVSHSTYGCYLDDVYWHSSCGIVQEKKQECGYGCTEGRCKIQVCNYGKCYYV